MASAPQPVELVVQDLQTALAVDVQALQDFAERALPLCLAAPGAHPAGLPALEEVGVVLVDDDRIAALHVEFMGIEGATDVITFQHGEIVISTETAARYAREFATSPLDEVRLYLIHGLLHLNGHEDQEPAEHTAMHVVQNEIFKSLIPSSAGEQPQSGRNK